MPKVNACKSLKKLKWKCDRLSPPWLDGGMEDCYVPMGKSKARVVIKAFGIQRRLPKAGWELSLGRCGKSQMFLVNEGGRYRLRARK